MCEGECVPVGDQEQRWGGHRWTSQEEDGSRPPGNSENGHDGTYGVESSRQYQHSQVSTLSVLYITALHTSLVSTYKMVRTVDTL